MRIHLRGICTVMRKAPQATLATHLSDLMLAEQCKGRTNSGSWLQHSSSWRQVLTC